MTNQAIDQDAATELKLCTENEGTLYPIYQAIDRMLARKVKAGTFDASKAPLAFSRYVEEGAKLYVKQNCATGTTWHAIFPPAVRREVCKRFATEWKIEHDAQASQTLSHAEIVKALT
jgi:uncharacterized protein YbaR (Trm112 family)